MADSKREADSLNDHLTSKRVKVTDSDAKCEAKERECDLRHVSEACEGASTESGSQTISGSQTGIFTEGVKSCVSEVINSSTATKSCKAGIVERQLSKLSSFDADAAEDKGPRHSMEDAWVILPDASLEYPGKLRCAHFAVYDGHGGRLAADYAKTHLHANVLSAGLPQTDD